MVAEAWVTAERAEVELVEETKEEGAAALVQKVALPETGEALVAGLPAPVEVQLAMATAAEGALAEEARAVAVREEETQAMAPVVVAVVGEVGGGGTPAGMAEGAAGRAFLQG